MLTLFASACLAGCAAASAPSGPPCADAPTATVATAAPSAAAAAASATPSGGVPAIPLDLPRAGEVVGPAPEPPTASPASSQFVHTILVVYLTKDGVASVDGKPLRELDALVPLGRERIARDPELRAVIQADRDARWEDVVGVMDRLRQAGIAKIAFGVELKN
jgi:biopolymer transport protein ExbD